MGKFLANPHFLEIFLISAIVQCSTIIFKYLTKIKELAEKGIEVHFDCLRIGVDLALFGIVSLLGVATLALRNPEMTQIPQAAPWVIIALLTQVALLGAAALFTASYNSWETTFRRGTVVPFVMGWTSLMISVYLFHKVYGQ